MCTVEMELSNSVKLAEHKLAIRAMIAYKLRSWNPAAAEIEEMVSEAILKAWAAKHKFQDNSSVRTWLTRIAINCAFDWQRKNRYRRYDVSLDGQRELRELFAEAFQDTSSYGCDPERTCEASDLLEIYHASVRTFNDLQQTVLSMRFEQGMRQRLIAQELGMSPDSVRNLIYRCRRNLRTAFAKAGVALN